MQKLSAINIIIYSHGRIEAHTFPLDPLGIEDAKDTFINAIKEYHQEMEMEISDKELHEAWRRHKYEDLVDSDYRIFAVESED